MGEPSLQMTEGKAWLLPDEGYSLGLASGENLIMTSADGSIAPWLEALAVLLRLKRSPADGNRRVVFVSEEQAREAMGFRAQALSSGADAPGPVYEKAMYGFDPIVIYRRRDTGDTLCIVQHTDTLNSDADKKWLPLYPVLEMALLAGGFPIHAALIEFDGTGVLLAGPSGVGKSTCCSRIPAPWKILCDEETLVMMDKQGNYRAQPLPTWSECGDARIRRSWDGQRHLPLGGIFFLEKAAEDLCSPMGDGKATALSNYFALQKCRRHWAEIDGRQERVMADRVFSNAVCLSRRVPSYLLRVSRKGRFWDHLRAALPVAPGV
jgi:SynChlorMet cassette protein ScmC